MIGNISAYGAFETPSAKPAIAEWIRKTGPTRADSLQE
jgi:hypothetical protein